MKIQKNKREQHAASSIIENKSKIMNKYPSNTTNKIKIAQINWINLLPAINNKEILKFGTKKTENIRAITFFGPKSLSCVGTPSDGDFGTSIKFYNDLDELTLEKFDIVIVDEPDFLNAWKSYHGIKESLQKISRLLKSNGVLFICFPDKKLLWSLKFKYLIKKAIVQTEFNNRGNYFVCTPSIEHPFNIITYSRNFKWLTSNPLDYNLNYKTFKDRTKIFLKKMIIYITGTYNPFRGVFFLTNKSTQNLSYQNLTYNGTIANIIKVNLNKITAIRGTARGESLALFISRDSLLKHYIFVYGKADLNLLLVIKIGFKSFGAAGDIKKEYENLLLVHKCNALFDKENIVIPKPLGFESFQQNDFSMQSPIQGKSLDIIAHDLFLNNDYDRVIGFLNEVVDKLIYIHNTLKEIDVNLVSTANKEYFQNYIPVSLDWTEENTYPSHDLVQHGDFAINNIFVDTGRKKWSVIDWEWMAKDYPPLFDIFFLITSFRFTDSGSMHQDDAEKFHSSFIYTYFTENPISIHIKKIIDRYCTHFQIERKPIFTFFTAYLLFQCNKYRLFYDPHPYRERYEKELIYAVENKNNFILK